MRNSVDNPRVRLRALLICALLCGSLQLATSPAVAAPAQFAGSSADGKAVFFTTTDKLVPGDTDSRVDVYVRSYDDGFERYVTRQVSFGPIGGNDAYHAIFVGASADGTRAFFVTEEKLVSGDQDLSQDIYVRDLAANTTELVSDGDPGCAPCGDANFSVSFAPGGIVPSGQRVFFRSAERLSSTDKDFSIDVYVRDLTAETTTLVSVGDSSCAGEDCGNGAFGAEFRGASQDGTVAFFASEEKLADTDQDGGLLDVYSRDLTAGTTVQVSEEGDCPASADCSASYGGASPDGSRAFIETKEQLAVKDEDSAQDVYEWTASGVALVSVGAIGGNSTDSAVYKGVSVDGSRVFFETSEKLLAADEDSTANDLYERAGGETALVSTGPIGGAGDRAASLAWISPDGSTDAVLFETAEQMTAADKDEFLDVYSRDGTATTLLSAGATTGNGPFDASYAAASDDGSHLFVVTSEKLVSSDTDSAQDVYDIVAGVITLVSTGPLAGGSSIDAGLPEGAAAEDGSHAFFTTEERVTEADLDAELDVYDHFSGGTLLASTGNFAPLGPPTPSQLSTDPSSPGASLTPRLRGQSDPNTAIKVYATADCSGAPVATGTQVELGGTGIQVNVAEGSTTSFRATATDANGDTSPCSSPTSYTQQSSPPPPPPPGEEGASTGDGTGAGSGGASGGGEPPRGGGKGGAVYVIPRTRITFAPASKTRARRPIFRFTDSTGQDGTSFRCKLDRGRWHDCTSPVKLKRLKLGRHVFQVIAINAVGAPEPVSVKRPFKVVGG